MLYLEYPWSNERAAGSPLAVQQPAWATPRQKPVRSLAVRHDGYLVETSLTSGLPAMDLCSPHVIIRLLAAVGVALFVSGLYLTDVSHSQYDAVVEYNAQVKAWKDTYMQQFLGARFQVEVQAPGAPRFQVELQDFVDTRAWSIPQGYRPELELSPYTPAQFIHTVQPVDIVGGDKHTEYLQRPVNVTLVASSQGNSSVGEQLLHAGEVTIVSQWPSSHCAQAAAASAESCSVLRAVVRFCFVVSYQGD
eukprot:COSAG01_NODE_16236_length_1256_cov_9.203111_2_plen_248_part_01